MWGISPAFPKMPHTPTQQEVEFGDVVDASFGNGCILLLTTGGMLQFSSAKTAPISSVLISTCMRALVSFE